MIRCGRVRVRTVFVRIRRRSGLKARGLKLNVKTVRTFTQSMIIRSVKTMWHAAEWLEDNHDADNYFLWVEAFDPHEPYDCPEALSRSVREGGRL